MHLFCLGTTALINYDHIFQAATNDFRACNLQINFILQGNHEISSLIKTSAFSADFLKSMSLFFYEFDGS